MHCNDQDWQLCQQAGHGSAEAYTQLYQRYRQVVRGYLRQHGPTEQPADLDDLEQQVWCAVWTGLAGFRGRSELPTWLVAIAKHVVRAAGRHRLSVERTLARLVQQNRCAPEADASGPVWDRLSLADALAALGPTQRQVIRLRYFEGLTDPQIARRLRVPLGTVKGRLRTGLGRLRRCLGSRRS